MPWLRCFKQLEFLIVGQALRLPNFVAAPLRRGVSAATERRGYSGRNRALESHARELLRQLGADKLAREIRCSKITATRSIEHCGTSWRICSRSGAPAADESHRTARNGAKRVAI